jgi:hypothetical protein
VKRKDETKILAEQAFWELLREGTPPTIDLLNRRLIRDGHEGRDRNLLSEVCKACWQAVGKRASTTFALPGVPEETALLFVKLTENMRDVARAELEEERREIESAAAARIEAVQTESNAHREAAEAAQHAQRETATAFDALKTEQDRLREDLHHAARTAEVERTRANQAAAESAGAAARAAAEAARFESERQAAAADRTRQALEIDSLRQESRGLKADLKSQQQEGVASQNRERILTERIEGLIEQLSIARGVERAQAAHMEELSRSVAESRDQLALSDKTLAATTAELDRLRRELVLAVEARDARPHLTVNQLSAALAQAWLSGATNPGKPARGEDAAQGFSDRAERYTVKALKVLGAVHKKNDAT